MNLTQFNAESASDASKAPHVLFVVRGRDPSDHPGISDGLKEMVTDETLRGATLFSAEPGEIAEKNQEFGRILLEQVRDYGTDFIVLHHFHSPTIPDPRPDIERVKLLDHRPLVALTNGDAFANGFRRPSFPRMFMQAAEAVDVVFSTSMGPIADFIVQQTRTPTALLPNGASQPRIRGQSGSGFAPPDFDVVFVGSSNRPRNPLRGYYSASKRREELLRQLSRRFGSAFAVFGRGWEGIEGWQGTIPYDRQQEACRRAKLVVGGVPYSTARYYLSDRPFNQIVSEVPFVELAVEGVDAILRDGEHWHLASSIEDLVDRCDDLLASPATELRDFGRSASEFVLANHTEAARSRSLIRTMAAMRRSITAGSEPPPPDLSFLLPEVDRAAEMPLATRGWSAGA